MVTAAALMNSNLSPSLILLAIAVVCMSFGHIFVAEQVGHKIWSVSFPKTVVVVTWEFRGRRKGCI